MWKCLFSEYGKRGVVDVILTVVGKTLSNRKVLKYILKVIQISLKEESLMQQLPRPGEGSLLVGEATSEIHFPKRNKDNSSIKFGHLETTTECHASDHWQLKSCHGKASDAVTCQLSYLRNTFSC